MDLVSLLLLASGALAGSALTGEDDEVKIFRVTPVRGRPGGPEHIKAMSRGRAFDPSTPVSVRVVLQLPTNSRAALHSREVYNVAREAARPHLPSAHFVKILGSRRNHRGPGFHVEYEVTS